MLHGQERRSPLQSSKAAQCAMDISKVANTSHTGQQARGSDDPLAPPPFLRRPQARALTKSGGATGEPLPAQAAGSATTAPCLKIALH